jgi:hypothetical protein
MIMYIAGLPSYTDGHRSIRNGLLKKEASAGSKLIENKIIIGLNPEKRMEKLGITMYYGSIP